MRNGVLKMIRDDLDPEYDPIPAACEAAGVSLPVFNVAESRVYSDGYFGPISQSDFDDEDSSRPSLTVKEGVGILAAVAGEIPDFPIEEYVYTDNCGCPDGECEGHLAEVGVVESREIVRDRFAYFVEIYGDSPLNFAGEVPERFRL